MNEFKKDMKILECIQKKASNLVTRLEGKSCEEWLMILGLSGLEKGTLRDDHISVYRFLMGGIPAIQ